jgi:hypothetical protein
MVGVVLLIAGCGESSPRELDRLEPGRMTPARVA